MTYIKNNKSTKALPNNIIPQKVQNQEVFNFFQLCIIR